MNRYKDEMNELHAPQELIARTLEKVHAAEAETTEDINEAGAVSDGRGAAVESNNVSKDTMVESSTADNIVAFNINNDYMNGKSPDGAAPVNDGDSVTKEVKKNGARKIYPYILIGVSIAACAAVFLLARMGLRNQNSKSADYKKDESVFETVQMNEAEEADESYYEDTEQVEEEAVAGGDGASDSTDDVSETNIPEAGNEGTKDSKGADEDRQSKDFTGQIDSYDKENMIKKYSTDMDSLFLTFPDSTEGMIAADYQENAEAGLLDSDGYFVLDVIYDKKSYEKEKIRLSKISCEITKGSESYKNSIRYDEEMYAYPAYIAVDGFDYVYEYALMDDENNHIIYILLSYPDVDKLGDFSAYLKTNKDDYKLDNSKVLENFTIYAHKFPGDDYYTEVTDSE